VSDRAERVAVVTGAARGIGAATVLALAEQGWAVLAVDQAADDPALPYPLGTGAQLEAVAAEVALALKELSDAETCLEKIFGEETMVMMWADPLSLDNFKLYKGDQEDLRQVRLLAEQAQERLGRALALKGDPYSLSSLVLGAQLLDYAGMRYLYALETAESWQQMGSRPSRRSSNTSSATRAGAKLPASAI